MSSSIWFSSLDGQRRRSWQMSELRFATCPRDFDVFFYDGNDEENIKHKKKQIPKNRNQTNNRTENPPLFWVLKPSLQRSLEHSQTTRYDNDEIRTKIIIIKGRELRWTDRGRNGPLAAAGLTEQGVANLAWAFAAQGGLGAGSSGSSLDNFFVLLMFTPYWFGSVPFLFDQTIFSFRCFQDGLWGIHYSISHLFSKLNCRSGSLFSIYYWVCISSTVFLSPWSGENTGHHPYLPITTTPNTMTNSDQTSPYFFSEAPQHIPVAKWFMTPCCLG